MKFVGLLDYFPPGRFIVCPTPEDKRAHVRRLAKSAIDSGMEPASIAIIGDRIDVELAVAVELRCVAIRMRLRNTDGIPEGKYGKEEFFAPHYEVEDWIALKGLPVFNDEFEELARSA
jgi:histidinol phosphatase-like enzyme